MKLNIARLEVWKAVEGFPYEVSSFGRVRRSHPSARLLVLSKNKKGYHSIEFSLGGTRFKRLVHRLVAHAFLEPCPAGFQVNHKDGVKSNNSPSNLEYVTPSENVLHAYRLGLMKWVTRGPIGNRGKYDRSGERNHRAKLKELDIPVIRKLRAAGMSCPRIAHKFGVNPMTINLILLGKTWKHVK